MSNKSYVKVVSTVASFLPIMLHPFVTQLPNPYKRANLSTLRRAAVVCCSFAAICLQEGTVVTQFFDDFAAFKVVMGFLTAMNEFMKVYNK
ncbi:MAG: hypothetical protein GY782_09185 [Gammaproteobacteria bacterium]|nr:hypothetical protein [Gammaproteobacteria bacterium]